MKRIISDLKKVTNAIFPSNRKIVRHCKDIWYTLKSSSVEIGHLIQKTCQNLCIEKNSSIDSLQKYFEIENQIYFMSTAVQQMAVI